MKADKLLTDVVIIRPVLIILLVFYHAFAIYSGAWEPIDGIGGNLTYWWLDKLSYAFMLESFVFVSGYVFGYQVRSKGQVKLQAEKLFWGKFKRLIIPCFIFGLLYIVLIDNGNRSIISFTSLYNVINGVGHLWFLPMLFECFVAIWVIEKLRLKYNHVIPVLFFVSLLPIPPLPLQLHHTFYYLLFFYIGYIIQFKSIRLVKYYSLSFVVLFSISFILLFCISTLSEQSIISGLVKGGGNSLIIRALSVSLMNLLRIVYSSIGLFALLCFAGYVSSRLSLPVWLERVGGYCMGVYIFQQFILKYLYYQTSLPYLLGTTWLPWTGFVLALLISLFITHVMLKCRIGRFLLG